MSDNKKSRKTDHSCTCLHQGLLPSCDGYWDEKWDEENGDPNSIISPGRNGDWANNSFLASELRHIRSKALEDYCKLLLSLGDGARVRLIDTGLDEEFDKFLSTRISEKFF